ncbi:hypothetical protein D3C72_1655410 [compost metagenome]
MAIAGASRVASKGAMGGNTREHLPSSLAGSMNRPFSVNRSSNWAPSPTPNTCSHSEASNDCNKARAHRAPRQSSGNSSSTSPLR